MVQRDWDRETNFTRLIFRCYKTVTRLGNIKSEVQGTAKNYIKVGYKKLLVWLKKGFKDCMPSISKNNVKDMLWISSKGTGTLQKEKVKKTNVWKKI